MKNHETGYFEIICKNIKKGDAETIRNLKIQVKDTTSLVEGSITLEKDYNWSSKSEMIKDLNEKFSPFFSNQPNEDGNHVRITKPTTFP